MTEKDELQVKMDHANSENNDLTPMGGSRPPSSRRQLQLEHKVENDENNCSQLSRDSRHQFMPDQCVVGSQRDNENLPEEALAGLKGGVQDDYKKEQPDPAFIMSLSNNSIELIGSQDIPIRNHVDGRFSERDAVLGIKDLQVDRNDDEDISATATKADQKSFSSPTMIKVVILALVVMLASALIIIIFTSLKIASQSDELEELEESAQLAQNTVKDLQ